MGAPCFREEGKRRKAFLRKEEGVYSYRTSFYLTKTFLGKKGRALLGKGILGGRGSFIRGGLSNK